MGRLSALLLVLVLAATAALGLAACGEEGADLLPGATASEITSNLDQVRDLVGEGECVGAADAAEEVSAQIEALDGVDQRLKAALREGAARLNELVAGCEEPEEELEEAVEPAIEPEEAEDGDEEEREKPDKSKPQKEADEAPEEETEPSLPPQAEGKAKGHEKQEEAEAPPETGGGTPAGGIAPSEEAGGE